jgi:hypothetical protein
MPLPPSRSCRPPKTKNAQPQGAARGQPGRASSGTTRSSWRAGPGAPRWRRSCPGRAPLRARRAAAVPPRATARLCSAPRPRTPSWRTAGAPAFAWGGGLGASRAACCAGPPWGGAARPCFAAAASICDCTDRPTAAGGGERPPAGPAAASLRFQAAAEAAVNALRPRLLLAGGPQQRARRRRRAWGSGARPGRRASGAGGAHPGRGARAPLCFGGPSRPAGTALQVSGAPARPPGAWPCRRTAAGQLLGRQTRRQHVRLPLGRRHTHPPRSPPTPHACALRRQVDDGSGEIGLEQFCSLASQLGLPASMAEAQGMFRRFGCDSVLPFQRWAAQLVSQPSSRQLADECAGGRPRLRLPGVPGHAPPVAAACGWRQPYLQPCTCTPAARSCYLVCRCSTAALYIRRPEWPCSGGSRASRAALIDALRVVSGPP